MKRYIRGLSVVSLFLLLPLSAAAQAAQPFSIQVSAIGNVLFGEAETDVGTYAGSPESGFGGEVQIRYNPGAFSIGIGGQVARHTSAEPPFTGLESQESDQTFLLAGVFIEPRQVVATGRTYALYLSGRFSLSSISSTHEGVGDVCEGTNCVEVEFSDEGTAVGYTLNAGGGVLVALSDRVNLDLGATFGIKEFGDLEVVLRDDQGLYQSTSQGNLGSFPNVVVRVGLAFGLGG